MYSLRQKKISFKSIFELFSVVIILLNSGYYRSTTTDSYLPLLMLIAVAVTWLIVYRKEETKTRVGLVLALLLGIALSILANLNSANILSGGRVAVTILCSFVLVRAIPISVFSKYFSTLIKWIIIISLAFSIVLRFGAINLPEINHYYDLLVVTSRGGDRAYGIFWEPGVFATMIIISMLLEYFLCNKPVKAMGIILYSVGIFLTKSTAGIMLLIIVAVGILWRLFERKRKSVVYTILFASLIILTVAFYENIITFLVELSPDWFGKLVEIESDTTSTRFNIPLVNMQVFLDKPLFGWGFTDSSTEILKLMDTGTLGKVVAQTSTSTQMMAAIGVLGIVYSIAFVFPVFSKKSLPYLSTSIKVILALCMMLIVNKEPHIFIVTSWMMLLYLNMLSEPTTTTTELAEN